MIKEPGYPAGKSYAELGGRFAEVGHWPTRDEWLKNPAYPRDAIFHNESDVHQAFPEHIAKLEEIMASTDITRELLIKRLMDLSTSQPEIVRSVKFDKLVGFPSDGSYAAPEIYDESPPWNTFKVSIDLRFNPDNPKQSFFNLDVSDYIVQGLAEPQTISAQFSGHSAAWMYGGLGSGSYLTLQIPGEDNTMPTRVTLAEFKRFTDPEAVEQTLDLSVQLAQELFGPESPQEQGA